MKAAPHIGFRFWFCLVALWLAGCSTWGVLPGQRRWLKSALHTHTNHSDGEAPASAMLRWYRTHGYDVVALTDHNRNMPFGLLSQNTPDFLVIPGVEFTSVGGSQPVHINGLFTLGDVSGIHAATPRLALRKMLSDFQHVQALSVINHPNYEGTLTPADLEGLDFSLLEVFNGSSGARNDGDATSPPVEALWNALLAKGRHVYGVATDDAHGLPGGNNSNLPGRAWVMIYARLDLFDIREALESGRFYATTGPDLTRFDLSSRGIRATVRARPGLTYRWELIDSEGVTIQDGNSVFVGRPTLRQVFRRAKLTASDGSRLYLQPLFPP